MSRRWWNSTNESHFPFIFLSFVSQEWNRLSQCSKMFAIELRWPTEIRKNAARILIWAGICWQTLKKKTERKMNVTWINKSSQINTQEMTWSSSKVCIRRSNKSCVSGPLIVVVVKYIQATGVPVQTWLTLSLLSFTFSSQ